MPKLNKLLAQSTGTDMVAKDILAIASPTGVASGIESIEVSGLAEARDFQQPSLPGTAGGAAPAGGADDVEDFAVAADIYVRRLHSGWMPDKLSANGLIGQVLYGSNISHQRDFQIANTDEQTSPKLAGYDSDEPFYRALYAVFQAQYPSFSAHLVAVAQTKGFAIPSAETISRAHHLLERLCNIRLGNYELSPLMHGSVTVSLAEADSYSLTAYCFPNGQVLFDLNRAGQHCDWSYESITDVSEEMMRYILSERPSTSTWDSVDGQASTALRMTPEEGIEQARRSFDELDEYAEETGRDKPHKTVREVVRRLLWTMCQKFPIYYSLYPEEGGGISVNASSGTNHVVWLEFEPEGKVSCTVARIGSTCQAQYGSAHLLPDRFLAEALRPSDSV